MSALLAARGITRSYGGRQVLGIGELELNAGETLCLMGPNGAGKSTLIRILNLLERPDAGEVFFRGSKVGPGSGEVRRRMAAVFQQPFMFSGSVAANVSYGLRLRRLPRAEVKRRAAEIMEEMGLTALRQQDVRLLSGGEVQRVALARAIVLEPELLFLDEPAASLDAYARGALHRDLRRIAGRRGVSTIYVTHSPAEALACGDRLGVLIDGGFRQIGPVRDVFAAPVEEAVAALLGRDGAEPSVEQDAVLPLISLSPAGQVK